jgi:hypothetical protein
MGNPGVLARALARFVPGATCVVRTGAAKRTRTRRPTNPGGGGPADGLVFVRVRTNGPEHGYPNELS